MHKSLDSVADHSSPRARELMAEHQNQIYDQTSRLFAILMMVQWAAGVIAAIWISPRTWAGPVSSVHIHVWLAIFLGGAITSLPVYLALTQPRHAFTRHMVAVCQMLMSALLIHLSGGRIETHFHVFGSLAFLAYYRDWRVLLSATIVVAADHALRGLYYPQSVFGVLTASPWRWIEHACWVIFEDVILVKFCVRGGREMWEIAKRQAWVEQANEQLHNANNQLLQAQTELRKTNEIIELTVRQRTAELEKEITDRRLLEGQLVQAQKLESIGQLASGIAHEINTPIQYIGDNTRFLGDAFASLKRLVGQFVRFTETVGAAPDFAAQAVGLQIAAEHEELDYLLEEIPKAIDQSTEGVARVAGIVLAMKEFSHPGSAEKELVDINRAITNTLMVCRNEWKYVAEVETDLDAALPPVVCLGGEIKQVVLNLVVNAAQAIRAAERGGAERGRIKVSTLAEPGWVEIRVEDNGTGIPEAVRQRIFTPFFTTKEVGKGTGQGLYMARTVVVKKHGGALTFETTEGVGTTFTARLPLQTAASEEKVA